jgi:hypothetical protein
VNSGKEISDFVVGYLQEGYQQEVLRSDSLDSKSNFLITIASFLTGLSFALITLAYKDLSSYFQNSGDIRLSAGILLVLSNGLLLGSVVFSILASSVRSYWAKLVYSAEDIDKWFDNGNTYNLRITFAKKVQQQWLHNRIENDAKAQYLRISFLLLGAGSFILSMTVTLTMGYLLVWLYH